MLLPALMTLLLLKFAVTFTLRLGILAHESVFDPFHFDKPNIIKEYQTQIEGNMEQHSEDHHVALVKLDFLIRLHIRETHHIIHTHQDHDLVKVFHFVGPRFLERVCSTSHNHSHNRLEDQPTHLEE